MQTLAKPMFAFGLALALAALPLAAPAQAYPSKGIHVIIAFPPGAAHDLLGRTLAAEFSKGFAPGSIAENKPGGSTVIATDFVAKSAPDGHTLLVVGFPFPLMNSMFTSSRIDVLRDFTPVINVMSSPNALVVKGDSPYQTLGQLIAAAKANPGKVTYASVGNGSSPHLGMELLKRIAGVDILNVPYKGSSPARAAILGGEVDVMFDNLPNVVPNVKGGRLRTLAVTSPARSRLMPEAPTMIEAGVPGYVMDIWFGVAVPAGTPPAAVAALNGEINRIIATPEVKARLENLGLNIVGGSAEAFQKTVAADVAKWAAVVRDAGIKAQ
jgi:tripartite-type tricarboxylate transporter receptor subunit TctC